MPPPEAAVEESRSSTSRTISAAGVSPASAGFEVTITVLPPNGSIFMPARSSVPTCSCTSSSSAGARSTFSGTSSGCTSSPPTSTAALNFS